MLSLPSEEEASFMYKYAAGYLRSKGYEHYEVSSYAQLAEKDKPSPWRSRHNQIYWATDSQWFAFGLGATSFVGGKLVARPRTLVGYLQWVDELCCEADGEIHQPDAAQDRDLLLDIILKRLRTSEGLSLRWVRSRYTPDGEQYVQSIIRGAELAIELGLARLEDEVLCLTDPTGFLYSNSIISTIFAELENLPDWKLDSSKAVAIKNR